MRRNAIWKKILGMPSGKRYLYASWESRGDRR
jgi:hypothetical protein